MLKNFLKIVGFLLVLPGFAYGRGDFEVMRDVENALIFDGADRVKIQELNQVKKRPALVIDKIGSKKEGDGKIDFKVSSGSRFDLSVKKKEKLAYSAFVDGQYEVALELYRQILRKQPKNDYARYCLALTYQKMRQNAKAKAIYRELLRGDVENREEIVANLLGIIADDSPREAVYMLSRLTRQHPNSAYLMAETGVIYEKLRNYGKAVEFLERAVALDGGRVDYRYNLAVAYDKAGFGGKAVEAYYAVLRGVNGGGKWKEGVDVEGVKGRILELRG